MPYRVAVFYVLLWQVLGRGFQLLVAAKASAINFSQVREEVLICDEQGMHAPFTCSGRNLKPHLCLTTVTR